MTKKLCALFLLCSMAIGFVVPVAFAAEPFGAVEITETTLTPFVNALDIVTNGGMEYTESETKLAGWGSAAGFVDTDSHIGSPYLHHNDLRKPDPVPENNLVHGGKRAMRLIHAGGDVETRLVQTLDFKRSGVLTSYRCEMGISFYKVGEITPAQLVTKVTLQQEDGSTREEAFTIGITNAPAGEWITKMYALTLPVEAIGVSMTVRLAKSKDWTDGKTGDLVVDDIFFLQECDEKLIEPERPTQKLPPVEGTTTNIFAINDAEHQGNLDFEYAQPGSKPWWFILDTPAAERFSTAENHTPGGQRSLYLKNVTNIRGRAYQYACNLIPGATYQLSWWYKIATPVQASVSTETKFHNGAIPNGDATKMNIEKGDGFTAYQDGEWHEIVVHMVAPYPTDNSEFVSAEVCIRIGGSNTSAYFDDVSLYMVKKPDVAQVQSDEAIYYTEWKEGVVSATVNEYYKEAMTGGSMRCTLLEGEKELQAPETILFTEEDGVLKAEWRFQTVLMTPNKVGQTYAYKAEFLDSEGNILETKTDKIYRFDRPHYLGADGIFRKNGKEYNLGLGNSGSTTIMSKNPHEGGVKILMLVGEGNIPLKEKMDMAYEKGYLVMLNLGNSEVCGGSPSMIQQTRDKVREVKNHPALFGYKLQDEPTQKGTPEEYLRDGYVAIRELDPNHVVYSCDGIVGLYPVLARYTDYMDSDRYPGGKTSGSVIYEASKASEEASRGRKPFAILQKAYQVYPSDMYIPAIDEYRHYAYQTLFAGAAGWGYHQLGSNTYGDPFMDRPIWQEIVQWKESGEQDMMYDCFVNGKYPLINAYEDAQIKWHLYAANGKLYAFVLNLVGGVGATDGSKTVEIPLTDASAGKALGSFSAICKWGGEGSAIGTDKLTIEVPSFTAQTWEITLTNTVDFSNYKTVKYNDIADAPWAYQAVARLKDEGILNEETALRFAPLENVKRGDYAMFLVRALELTAKVTTNFVDVLPTAEYYTEVGIGRKLGICQSLGGNTFRPEEPMTREDMMTMTARALRCAGAITSEGAGTAFGDNPTVPDWAVLDTASYVYRTFLHEKSAGRAEVGGNVTRAEAAVMIDRVRQWKNLADKPGDGDFVIGYANWLSAEEAEILWEAFLNEEEGSILTNGLWNRTIDVNGNRYWLIANFDEVEKSTWARCHLFNTCTAILQNKGVSAYTDGGELHVTLPPSTVAVYRMAAETNGYLVKDGIYLAAYEDGATISLPSGKYGAWYRYNGETADMLSFLENGEEISGLKPGEKLKFFSWEWPSLSPAGRAVEYEKNSL